MATRLFVGNLSFQTTSEDIQTAFAQDGRRVNSVNVVTDRESGRSRGFAFVEMDNDSDARAAITALDGTELDGRALRVNEAEQRSKSGGGGYNAGRRNARGGW